MRHGHEHASGRLKGISKHRDFVHVTPSRKMDCERRTKQGPGHTPHAPRHAIAHARYAAHPIAAAKLRRHLGLKRWRFPFRLSAPRGTDKGPPYSVFRHPVPSCGLRDCDGAIFALARDVCYNKAWFSGFFTPTIDLKPHGIDRCTTTKNVNTSSSSAMAGR